jgi:hypothetical protein
MVWIRSLRTATDPPRRLQTDSPICLNSGLPVSRVRDSIDQRAVVRGCSVRPLRTANTTLLILA